MEASVARCQCALREAWVGVGWVRLAWARFGEWRLALVEASVGGG